jgi:hypothetical protein
MSKLGDHRLTADPGADFVPRPDIAGRLRDALGVLDAIEQGELFAAAPATNGDRRRHDAGVAALAVLGRDLERLLAEVRAYDDLGQVRMERPG